MDKSRWGLTLKGDRSLTCPPFNWVRPLLVFLLFFSCPAAVQSTQRIESKDTNGDGRPDEWVIYDGETPVRIERDRDGDGRREVVILLEAGKPVRSEVDRSGDGKPDLVQYFKKGKPVREEGDLNFDGKPDAWFYYDRAGIKMIGGKVDEDFNGTVDRTFGAVPQEEKRTTW